MRVSSSSHLLGLMALIPRRMLIPLWRLLGGAMVVACVLLDPTTATIEDNVLHIGAFYPLTGSFSSWGQGCLPAAQLALDHVNSRSDVLPDHTLKLVNVDTQGSPGVTTRELFSMLYNKPPKVALLGPYLSQTAVAVAQTARWWHLLQVAPTPFTPTLSNRELYPYVFRIRAALTTFNPTRVAFIKSLGWKRVAIITRQTDYFLQTTDLLYKDLEAANVSVVTSEVYQTEGEPVEELLRIKNLNARIIFVFAYDEYARKIFCQVHKLGMFGPQYVWILHYSNDPYWMYDPIDDCTPDDLQEAASGHFVTRDITLREDDIIPLAGMGTEEFIEAYKSKASNMSMPPSNFYAPIVYDALWTLALALNESVRTFDPRDILYNDTGSMELFTQQLMANMDVMAFEGMTGTVSFTKNGEIATLKTKIMQFEDGNYTTLGVHDALQQSLTWLEEIKWKGGLVPYDDLQVLRRRRYLGNEFYVMVALSLAGILLAAFFFYYNIKHRHMKAIRMSSPNLNNIIISGAVLTYCSVIAAGFAGRPLLESRILEAVYTKYLTLLIGYSLGFGALFTKTWRVFKIFTTKTAKKVSISDVRLFAIVLAFILMDVVFVLLWFNINPLYLVSIEGPPTPSPENADVLLVPWVRLSTSDNVHIWHLVIYVYKGLALVFGVFLAFQTRGVTIPALNDSKYIGIAIYNVVTICMLALLTTMVLDSLSLTLKYVITSGCTITASTVTMCTVFLPKVFRTHSAVAPATFNIPASPNPSRNTGPLQPRAPRVSFVSHISTSGRTWHTRERQSCPNCERQMTF